MILGRTAQESDRMVLTETQIRSIALDLPGAYEQPTHGGRPSWRTTPRMFAWLREDPDALVVWVESVEEKAAMTTAHPSRFFTTAHYDGHPVLLVDLENVDAEEARDLITESWRLRAPQALVRAWDAAAGRFAS